jgi:hypothetical protein
MIELAEFYFYLRPQNITFYLFIFKIGGITHQNNIFVPQKNIIGIGQKGLQMKENYQK